MPSARLHQGAVYEGHRYTATRRARGTSRIRRSHRRNLQGGPLRLSDARASPILHPLLLHRVDGRTHQRHKALKRDATTEALQRATERAASEKKRLCHEHGEETGARHIAEERATLEADKLSLEIIKNMRSPRCRSPRRCTHTTFASAVARADRGPSDPLLAQRGGGRRLRTHAELPAHRHQTRQPQRRAVSDARHGSRPSNVKPVSGHNHTDILVKIRGEMGLPILLDWAGKTCRRPAAPSSTSSSAPTPKSGPTPRNCFGDSARAL